MEKVVFITIFQGVEAKNILRTDIYNKLISDENVRIVFFVSSQERAEHYKKEFSHPRVVYESISAPELNGLNKFFSNLSFILLDTETVNLRRKMDLEIDGNYFKYSLGFLVNRVFARKTVRRIVRFFDYHFAKSSIFSEYFKKYNPSAVFLAHLFDDLEIRLLKEAKYSDVKSIGFINSWDKLTARNIIRVLPDKLFVFNNIVKEEALRCADMPECKIEVVGIPQYDWHMNYKPIRRIFF
jgi:hypothetical protein